MADKLIITDIFRVSFPHLDTPYKDPTSKDEPKYSISMLFDQSGTGTVQGRAQIPNSVQSILDGLNDVCMEEWNMPYAQAATPAMGVQFPPSIKNGNEKFQKDKNKNFIPDPANPGSFLVDPITVNKTIVSAKNIDPVDTMGPDAVSHVDPKVIKAGHWAKAQLRASAYITKDGNRIVALQLMNVMYCYEDEEFGSGGVAESGETAFAGMAITDTNITQGTGMVHGAAPALTPAPITAPPVNINDIDEAPAPPPTVTTPPAPPQDPVKMNPGLDYAEHIKAGWTDETLIAHNKAVPNFLNPAG